MKQFNLEKWLQDRSRKVVTRNGIEAEIIHDKYPLVAIINGVAYNFDNDGKFKSNKSEHGYDLFFADKEEVLTEFEKELNRIVTAFSDAHAYMDETEIHHYSKGLLDLARKEIEKSIEEGTIEFAKSYMEDVNPSFEKVKEYEEFWKWKMSCLRGINKAYTQGKKDALKDLPNWKKAEKDEELDCHVAIQQDGRVVLSDFVQKDEYYITLDVLKTLPKEE